LDQTAATAEVGIGDLVNATDVREMTTLTVLRTILQFQWVATDPNWITDTVEWYVAVMRDSVDPAQGVYAAPSREHAEIVPSVLNWEANDPLRIETNILLVSGNAYGEPSDNIYMLRADLPVKRTLNDGDRLCFICRPEPFGAPGGTFTVFVDSFTLVKAA